MGGSPINQDELCMFTFPNQSYFTLLFRFIFIHFYVHIKYILFSMIKKKLHHIFWGENSKIPRFGKFYGKLALFRKYLAIYHFFSTRVSQNRVLNSTRAQPMPH